MCDETNINSSVTHDNYFFPPTVLSALLNKIFPSFP